MTIPVPIPPTPAAVFKSHFGTPPGTLDARAECEKWERLCGELLAERARLQAEVEKARIEEITREWAKRPVPPVEEFHARVGQSPSLEEFIADMRKELEAKK